MASDGEVNLRGTKKAEPSSLNSVAEKFGYAGNSHVDLPVWESAGQVIVVNPGGVLRTRVGTLQISSPEVSYLVGKKALTTSRVLDH